MGVKSPVVPPPNCVLRMRLACGEPTPSAFADQGRSPKFERLGVILETPPAPLHRCMTTHMQREHHGGGPTPAEGPEGEGARKTFSPGRPILMPFREGEKE